MDTQALTDTLPLNHCSSQLPMPTEAGSQLSRIAVVIPCFNASKSAWEVIEATAPYAGFRLAVDDGSTDDTAHWLHASGIETIGWPNNRGKGYALVEGMRKLLAQDGWELLITLDSDGQHDPADIPALLDAQTRTSADIIVGARDLRTKAAPWLRRFANRFSSLLIRSFLRIPLPDIQCGYRLYTRAAVEILLPHLRGGTFELETDILLLARQMGLSVNHTPIKTTYTAEATNRSAWRAWRHSRLIFQVCLYHLVVRRLGIGGKHS